jgi:hypothetical protein
MPFYEIVTDFKIEYLEKIKESVSLDDVYFMTNDFSIQEQITELGYRAEHIGSHFGDINQKMYNIYDSALKNTDIFVSNQKAVLFNNVPLVDGIKFHIFTYLVFLKQIESIFEEEKNIIFVFPNTEYYYFAIIDIGQKLGYETKYGICYVKDSNLVKMFFDGTAKSDSRFLYHETEFLYRIDTGQQKNPNAIMSILENSHVEPSEYAFFLNDNLYGLYLKPVIPIIKMFEEERVSFNIFTLDKWSDKWISDKGLKTKNLAELIDEITKIVLKHDYEIIVNFFDVAQTCITEDHVFRSLLQLIRNDSMARYLARTVALVYVSNFILKKFKFKSLILALDGGFPDIDVIASTAKIHKIRTNSIMIQSYTQHQPYLGYFLNADRIFVGGIRLKKELIELGVKENRLVVSGNPRYDYITDIKSPDRKRSDHIINILVAISRWQDDDKWLPHLIKFCNKHKMNITIKLHPMYKFVLQKFSTVMIEKIQNLCVGLNFKILIEPEIEKLLANSDIVIITMPSSTVGLEALLHEKPLILTNMNNQKYYDFTFSYHKEKVSLYATNVEELYNMIQKIINDRNVTSRLQKLRKKFNHNLNYLNDGKATKRVFNNIVKNKEHNNSFGSSIRKLFIGYDKS